MLVPKLTEPKIPVKKSDEAEFDGLDCQIKAFHVLY